MASMFQQTNSFTRCVLVVDRAHETFYGISID